MSRQNVLIGVEGNHDQAFISKVLQKLLGFSKYEKLILNDLEPRSIWRKFIKPHSNSSNLYERVNLPSILYTDTLSIGIYAGTGSNLIKNLINTLSNIDYENELIAFAIIADTDNATPDRVAQRYHKGLQECFPDFPNEVGETGSIREGSPALGLYILPNNRDSGVLDTLIRACGEIAYADYMEKARNYIDRFTEEEIQHWKPFDKDKAIIAAVASILRPGLTNTVTFAQDRWVSSQTEQEISELKNLTNFLKELLQIETDT